MSDDLTEKQRHFADEYLKDLNATQAAIRCGYSEKTAHAQASRLLTNVKIASYVAKRTKRNSDKLEITTERVLLELARIAFFDIRNIFDDNGKMLHVKDIPDDTAPAIASIEIERTRSVKGGQDPDGETIMEQTQIVKIKPSDKIKALGILCQYLKLADGDKEDTNPIDFVATPEKLLALARRLSFILSGGAAAMQVIDQPKKTTT